MALRTLLAGAFVAVISINVAPALERTEISWDELVPEVEAYDDPFIDLDYDTLSDLRTLYEYQKDPERFSHYDDYETRVDDARQNLEDQGLDPEYLFSQREVVMEKRKEAANAINPDLLGQPIRMPGYVLPLEMSGTSITEFLLVPYVGACIHTPPPNPNQIVYVVYPDGFQLAGLYTPVWITGELSGESSLRDIAYADGAGEVIVNYRLDASTVVDY